MLAMLTTAAQANSALLRGRPFYRPEAHLVESVSLAGLHGCLAVIQTTHRLQ